MLAVLDSNLVCTPPVRAIAVAHENANAVGTVELCCAPQGLVIEFVRISAYSEGYIPYPATSSELVTIPYNQVSKVEVDPDGIVHLNVNPSCTHFNRLALAGLTHNTQFDHAVSFLRRTRIERTVTIVALCLWVPLSIVLHLLFPSSSGSVLFGVPISASLVLHLLRRDVASKLVLFSRSSSARRSELLFALAHRLTPGTVRSDFAASDLPILSSAAASSDESQESDSGSMRGLFATAGVVAAVTALTILVGKNLLFSSPSEPYGAWNNRENDGRLPSSSSEPLAPAVSAIVPDSTPVVLPPPPCTCERADSPLWADGIPRMSVLASNRPGVTSFDRPSVYPEIAIVNNTSEDLRDVVMVVDFLLAPRDGQKARVVEKQDLFWEGRLGPGKAVKWRVRGRGDDFAVNSFVKGSLGNGVEPAPADAFYKLALSANTQSVRLHGTKMLAYLGDDRVAEGLEKLRVDGAFESDDTALQIAAASHPLRVCAIQSDPDPSDDSKLVVKACVYNAASVPATRPWITATASFSASTSAFGRWPMPEDLPSRSGSVTIGTISVSHAGDVDMRTAVVSVEAGR